MESGNNSSDPGNVYFDVPGGISSQFQVNNQLNPYSYAPVHSSFGIGSLSPTTYDQSQYVPLATDYETLRGIGESTPYNYNQYLTWGPGGYGTEIVNGYDDFGNPIIVRPGSSVPMEGYDDVEGYNWDLLPEHGPFYTDSPLVSPQRDAPSQEFYDSGVANVDRGIPGVLLGSQSPSFSQPYNDVSSSTQPWRPSGDPDLYQPGAGGTVPASISGSLWKWNPAATRRVSRSKVPNSGIHGAHRDIEHKTVYGDWGLKKRDGTWADVKILDRELIPPRPDNPEWYNDWLQPDTPDWRESRPFP